MVTAGKTRRAFPACIHLVSCTLLRTVHPRTRAPALSGGVAARGRVRERARGRAPRSVQETMWMRAENALRVFPAVTRLTVYRRLHID